MARKHDPEPIGRRVANGPFTLDQIEQAESLSHRSTTLGSAIDARLASFQGLSNRKDRSPAVRRSVPAARKVALTSCMRKLLTIFNAMMRTNTAWQQFTQPEIA
jgi:hypothetical protein